MKPFPNRFTDNKPFQNNGLFFSLFLSAPFKAVLILFPFITEPFSVMKSIFPSSSLHGLETKNNASFGSLLHLPPRSSVVHDLLRVFTDEGMTGNPNSPPACCLALFPLSTTRPSQALSVQFSPSACPE